MTDYKPQRFNKVLRELNISLDRAVEFLANKGIDIDHRPTAKISQDVYTILSDEFQTDKSKKVASKEIGEEKRKEKEEIRLALEKEAEIKRLKDEERKAEIFKTESERISGPKMVGKIDIDPKPEVKEEAPKEVIPEPEIKEVTDEVIKGSKKLKGLKQVGKIDVEPKAKPAAKKKKEVETAIEATKKEAPAPKSPDAETKVTAEVKPTEETTAEPTLEETQTLKTEYQKLSGPKKTGVTIDLSKFERPKKKPVEAKKVAGTDANKAKKKRKRIHVQRTDFGQANKAGNRGGPRSPQAGRKPIVREEPSPEQVQKQVRETLEKLQGKSKKGKGAKYRREKRDLHRQQVEKDIEQQEAESKVVKVTEFVTANEIATMMNISVTEVISACMSLGMMISMNQRLDAETITIVADEFGYKVDFVGAEVEETVEEEVDSPEDLEPRAPIVTVMGHVDHGKTSLLDYIRKANVIAGESGGITQHIGAYAVELEDGQKITFLDTPGHEAFTAMRARGTQVTDIAVIVISADDAIMPQTKEAISHAQAAGVPIVFAINKIDKPDANPDKVKEALAQMNLLVEDWGGKIQSHDVSALKGIGIQELLEKILLEAELLELKANPNKIANGSVVEAFLDKGKGYVATVLVDGGTLKVGDYILAGHHSGKVRALQDERGNNVKDAGPSRPVSILGLDGAPQAGDKFKVYTDEREAKQIAAKRSQLSRE